MNIKAIRTAQGLSQRELARRSGIHELTVIRLEADRHDPRVSTVQALADALGVPMAELFAQPTTTKRGARRKRK